MSDFTPSIVPPNVNSPLSAPKLKVMTVLGTRPEIIRLAAVIKTLEQHTNHVLVHTGQNYDYDLNQVFFDDLGVSKPNYFLNVDTSSLGHMLGELLIRTEEVILKEKPDAFLVLGDTNSAVSLIMAKRMKIPTYHMEAGNRSFDPNVPEEANRRLVDHLADDYEMGARVGRGGYRVALSTEVVETSIPAYSWSSFLDHQLRWSRTVRDARPWGYAGLIFTHGLGWALLNVLASGLSPLSLWLLGLSFFLRLTLAMMVGAEVLGDHQVLPNLWLLPFRDLVAMGVWVAGFAGNIIVWRDERFLLKDGRLHKVE